MVPPVCYPLFALIAGSLLGWYSPSSRTLFFWGFLLSSLFSSVLCVVVRNALLRVLPFLAAFLFLAAMRTSVRLHPEFPPHHLIHQAHGRPLRLEGIVRGTPMHADDWCRVPFEAQRLRSSERSRHVTGRVDLFLNGDVPNLKAGDILLLEARLRRIRNLGNPGEFNRAARSFLKRVYVKGSVADPGHLLRVGQAPGYGFQRWIQGVRLRLASFLDREKDPRVRGLLKTWLLGDRTELPASTVEDFRRSGLAHLLAISGLHVGLVGIMAFGTFRALLKRSIVILRRGWCTKLSAVGSLPVVLCYVLLAGSPVTAVRAGIMATLLAGCLLLDRPRLFWNAIATAALFILLLDPSALFSISFQLSFVTVAALLASASLWTPGQQQESMGLEPSRPPFLGRVLDRVKQIFLVSVTASLASGPLAALYFHRVTPFGVLANLLVVPLASGLVIPAGVFSGLLVLFFPWMAPPFLWIAGLGAGCTAWAAKLFATLPGASIPVGMPSQPEILLYYLALFLALKTQGSRWRRRLLLLIVSGLSMLILLGFLQSRWSRRLEITFLSVGNGDSTVMEFPGGNRMIIDGGAARAGVFDAGQRIVAPFLRYRRIHRVDVLVSSHGQADHYGGLSYLAEHFLPRELWIGPETGEEEEGYRDFLRFCSGKGIRVRRLCAPSDPIHMGGAELEILHPPCMGASPLPEPREARGGNVNNDSLVIRVSFGRVRFLFTGDIEKQGEEELLLGAENLDAFLLKVPHHGSSSSSSPVFLDRVGPSVAVVSTGAGNRYGFPSPSVTHRFRTRGSSFYRTDRDGAVRVCTDGHRLEVRSVLGRREVFDLETPGSCFHKPAEEAQAQEKKTDVDQGEGQNDPCERLHGKENKAG